MTEPAVHKIIVSPLDGTHVEGSVKITADCGHLAWIAPTGLRVVENPLVRTETVCLRCVDPVEVARLVREQGGVRSLPGARDELNRHLGVAEVDQFWARYRVREHDPHADA